MQQIIRGKPRVKSSVQVCAADTGCRWVPAAPATAFVLQPSERASTGSAGNVEGPSPLSRGESNFRGAVMKFQRLGAIAAAIASVGMILPTSAVAATPAAPAKNSDVAL